MAKEFTTKLFSLRWGHDDLYVFRWTETGWEIDSGAHHRGCLQADGTLKSTGNNEVIDMMRNDMIYPPVVIDAALAYVWDRIKGGAPDAEIQAGLDALAQWINTVSRNKPRGFWEGAF